MSKDDMIIIDKQDSIESSNETKKISDIIALRKFKNFFKSIPKRNIEESQDYQTSESVITIESPPPLTKKEILISLSIYASIFSVFTLFLFGIIFMAELSTVGILTLSCLDIFLLVFGSKMVYNRDLIFTGKIDWKMFLSYLIPFIILLVGFAFIFLFGPTIGFVENINYATQDPVSVALPIVLMLYFGINVIKTYLVSFDISLTTNSQEIDLRDYADEKKRMNHKVSKHISYSLLIAFISLFAFFYFELDITSIILGLVMALITINVIYYYFSDFLIDLRAKKKGIKRRDSNKKDQNDKISSNIINDQSMQKIPIKQKVIMNFKKVFAFLSLKHYFIILLIACFVIISYIFNFFHLKENFTKIIDIFSNNSLLIGLSLTVIVIFFFLPLMSWISNSFTKHLQKILEKSISKYFRMIFVSLIFFFVLKVLIFNFQDNNLEWVASLIVSPLLSVVSGKLRMVRKLTG
ncbi:MAG: hypothetical protein ACFFAS_06900 [Promethearchaeota archaeon]